MLPARERFTLSRPLVYGEYQSHRGPIILATPPDTAVSNVRQLAEILYLLVPASCFAIDKVF
jgi:hypothetical protein